MKETSEQLKSTAKGQKQTTQTPLVQVNRTFRAPVERVWAAWSRPEFVQQWWGPEEFTSPRAEIDFREGGQVLLAMRSPQGEVNWSVGTVTSIVPHQKIVFTDSFSDERGQAITPKDAGMKNWEGDYQGTITVNFEKLGPDQTRISIHHTDIPQNMYDDCVQGWNSSLNKLQRLVERH